MCARGRKVAMNGGGQSSGLETFFNFFLSIKKKKLFGLEKNTQCEMNFGMGSAHVSVEWWRGAPINCTMRYYTMCMNNICKGWI